MITVPTCDDVTALKVVKRRSEGMSFGVTYHYRPLDCTWWAAYHRDGKIQWVQQVEPVENQYKLRFDDE